MKAAWNLHAKTSDSCILSQNDFLKGPVPTGQGPQYLFLWCVSLWHFSLSTLHKFMVNLSTIIAENTPRTRELQRNSPQRNYWGRFLHVRGALLQTSSDQSSAASRLHHASGTSTHYNERSRNAVWRIRSWVNMGGQWVQACLVIMTTESVVPNSRYHAY